MSIQTYGQYLIKGDMGLLRGSIVDLKFHFRFWSPLDAIGGKVYFGLYAVISD